MRSFCSPLSISAQFYGYLKLLKLRRMERSRSTDVWSGYRTWDLLHKGRARLKIVKPAPKISELRKKSLSQASVTQMMSYWLLYTSFWNAWIWKNISLRGDLYLLFRLCALNDRHFRWQSLVERPGLTDMSTPLRRSSRDADEFG